MNINFFVHDSWSITGSQHEATGNITTQDGNITTPGWDAGPSQVNPPPTPHPNSTLGPNHLDGKQNLVYAHNKRHRQDFKQRPPPHSDVPKTN